MKKIIISLTLVMTVLFLSGCTTSPKVKTKWVKKSRNQQERYNNPTQFRYQPVIGTKQDDTKVMIDMGQWAKIWIKNYKNKNQTFVSSHSIVTKIREPDFISGEQIPRGRRDATYNTNSARSFTYRSNDLMYGNSSQGSYGATDGDIKEFVNNYEYSKKTKQVSVQKRKDITKFDGEIKKYIKKTRDAKARQERELEAQRLSGIKKEKERQSAYANSKSDAQYSSEDEYKNGGLK